MRTTLDLPEELIREAMDLTQIKTKTALIKVALATLIQQKKVKGIKDFFGKVDLDADLDVLRDRQA